MDKDNNSAIIAALALNRAFGSNPRIARSLIDNLGSSEAVFSLSENDLRELFRSDTASQGKISPSLLEYAAKEYDNLSHRGISFVYLYDEAYPALLRECEDAPVVLYVRGSDHPREIFSKERVFLSIVGTRNITPYGKRCCESIVQALSACGKSPTVVSGLALGVDITAQMVALGMGLPTIGVSPVGIDSIYPRRHGMAAEKICSAKGSCIVTDYPPETTPFASNFLRRNRIIAGLSLATILVESGARGGGLITARLASGYGRSVFAVPGRIFDDKSEGCNALIAGKIAEAVNSPSLLPYVLGLSDSIPARRNKNLLRESLLSRFGEEEGSRLNELCDAIRKQGGEVSPDELCRKSGLDYSEVARCIGILESEGFITTDVFRRCSINAKFA